MDLDPNEWESDRNTPKRRTEYDHVIETLIGAPVVWFLAWYFDYYGMCVRFVDWALSPIFG